MNWVELFDGNNFNWPQENEFVLIRIKDYCQNEMFAKYSKEVFYVNDGDRFWVYDVEAWQSLPTQIYAQLINPHPNCP